MTAQLQPTLPLGKQVGTSIPVTADCSISVIADGLITQDGLETLKKYIDLIKDSFPKSLHEAMHQDECPSPTVREWLRNNMTFYDTESDRPVLASVSSRIWYHATDSVAYPFDSVIDKSL